MEIRIEGIIEDFESLEYAEKELRSIANLFISKGIKRFRHIKNKQNASRPK